MEMAPGGSGLQVESVGPGDRLAPVRVSALCRIEAAGPLGEGDEVASGLAEDPEVAVERREVPFEQVDDMMARGFAVAAEIEDGGDLGEGETRGLGIPHESEPIDRLLRVVPVSVGRPVGRGEHPDLLVVANGLGWNPGAPGELSDPHHGVEFTPLDIPVGWKAYGVNMRSRRRGCGIQSAG